MPIRSPPRMAPASTARQFAVIGPSGRTRICGMTRDLQASTGAPIRNRPGRNKSARDSPCRPRSDWGFALQHQAVEVAPLVHVVIGVGLVDDAAVVPDHEIAVAPLVAVFVFFLDRMG